MNDNFQKVLIRGKALCSKAGAFVLSSNGEAIFIEGKHDWGEIHEKIIEIEGYLIIEEQFPTQESLIHQNGEYFQGMIGQIKILKDARICKILID